MNISEEHPVTYVSHLRPVVYDMPAYTLEDEIPPTVGRIADDLFEQLEQAASYLSNARALGLPLTRPGVSRRPIPSLGRPHNERSTTTREVDYQHGSKCEVAD